MTGRSAYFSRLTELYYPPQVHYRNAIADMSYDAYVVRNKQRRKLDFFLQPYQQIQYLSLDRHIQCRGWLIADHETGAKRKCPCYGDSLPLSATECMWESVHMLGPQADGMQKTCNSIVQFAALGELVQDERFGNYRSYIQAGIQ